MTIAVVPGSFDPITNGHLDIITRARAIFDEVVVGVAVNARKTSLLSLEQRIELVHGAVKHLTNIRVVAVPGLVADFARELGATALVKGVRGTVDLGDERQQAVVNREMQGIETVLLPASPETSFLSSSMIRDIASHGGNIAAWVPAGVPLALADALADSREPAAVA
ncbi:MAG: pantetheine-phosphate adenylyltransferase [Bifidobacteriaceae bacterium]|jgi:pantetheine-phosphate adenylyltransferase|nr:pantetheine-phosphate adenylyltransferase [Bifidobacteriaceae bacterium]